jgi:hypothetical protein
LCYCPVLRWIFHFVGDLQYLIQLSYCAGSKYLLPWWPY